MAAPQRRGALVTVEGIDGSGKTSVVDALGRWLERQGVKAAVQREPTTSWIGEAVRRAADAPPAPPRDMFLFFAGPAGDARPLRAEVKWGAPNPCHRHLYSTGADQGGPL